MYFNYFFGKIILLLQHLKTQKCLVAEHNYSTNLLMASIYASTEAATISVLAPNP